jgi:hypothetical protein
MTHPGVLLFVDGKFVKTSIISIRSGANQNFVLQVLQKEDK